MARDKRSGRSNRGPVPVVILSVALAAIPAGAHGGGKRQSWNAEYELGTERVAQDRNLDVTVAADSLVLRARSATRVTIPLNSIVGVMHDTVPHRPLDALRVPRGSALEDAASTTLPGVESAFLLAPIAGMGSQAVVLTAILFPEMFLEAVSSIVAMGKSWSEVNDRFVYIVWREQDTTKDVLLRMDGERHCSSLLAGIREASGRDVIDLPARREAFVRELAAGPSWSVALAVDGELRVGGRNVRPGRYTMALVEGEEGTGRIFLFSGDRLRLERLSTLASVTIEEADAEAAATQVEYRKGGGFTSVSAIRVGGRTIRFAEEPPRGEPRIIGYGGAPALVFEAGGHALEPVTLASYGGERAVRFPVYRPRMLESRGYLYVTPSRVAYDPALTPQRKDSVNAPRADVRSIRCPRGRTGGSHLAIELKEGGFTFRPIGRGVDMRPSVASEVRQIQRGFCGLILEAFRDFQAVEARLTPESR